jgi:class 3 adenylate cyclase
MVPRRGHGDYFLQSYFGLQYPVLRLLWLGSLQEVAVIGENPYYHRGPIKEARYFFNRARETARSLQMVRKGQSVSVIGPRRIGKTSLMFHLSDSTVRGENGFAPEQSLFVYIDGGMLGRLPRSDILRMMLQETVDQTGKEIDTRQIEDHHSFEQGIRALLKSGQQLVYLVDEFEGLAKNPNLDADFFSFLRGLTVRYNIAYVTASQVPLLALIEKDGQLSSPFFNIFVPIHLGLFSEDNARQMICKPSRTAGIEFPGDTEDFILDLAGPHPFFLQIACFHAFELAHEDPSFSEQACRQLEERVKGELKSHFDYFTHRLSEEERRVLACLLYTGQGITSTAILKDLELKCLVRQRNGRYIPVSRAFAHFVRQEIGTTWAATVAEGERRMATVLFADVVGFTPMSEQHIPEEILSIMKPALRMFVDVVDRHKGKVANFGGDSILALFGIPTEQPDDAIRAVRAALEIQSNVVAYAQELRQNKGIDFAARVGLDTGVVVLGEIGGEQRAEYTALGDAVNLARRMETHAEPGTIVISDHTYQQIRGRFKTVSLGLVHVKGKSEPIKAYRVLGEKTSKH